VAKKLGVAEQTIYLWRKKFRGQSVDEVREMKALLAENAACGARDLTQAAPEI
jgi:transposase-like protein